MEEGEEEGAEVACAGVVLRVLGCGLSLEV